MQIARASNPGGTTTMWVRDRLDGLWCDENFVDWYPRHGRPSLSPAQLATVCVLQFLLDLSDRQAAEAVCCRIDFKYAMVRHEAPLFPGGGGRTPTAGLSQQAGEAEGSLIAETRGRVVGSPEWTVREVMSVCGWGLCQGCWSWR
ncbi:transposase [Streptomyces sp. NPDC005970]|uniref:transposase n=1 Tax=Streptomyces sp. NPDC005970 TaxID=3156723 RepID=UPI0033CCA93E